MIQEIQFVNTSINIELGEIDANLTEITPDIDDLNNNDRASSELHNSTIDRLDIIFNAHDRIEIKYTNQIATDMAGSDSERQKLKDGILANVEKIHKNYEPSPHMPRHSTAFTEEKISVKRSLTPLLGENATYAKDIPRLEEWPTFSGEGEYNHIEFIRKIDMLQEDFYS
ncbi:hypothetical protein O181_103120 [Austropuccinia psidii MF-1]|uniref:Uncharacterized protein n=1 Tax=Austropuccinia psidii MF-1 TaxID=1389203 RepID=A0A9Q3PJG3_9BASI|nr:hypothetical protein [Austropuccinia psidii MF-1]